ncbi:MAG TPA: hypothetical protein VK255_00405, partial [Patescibacteria group bacterium]|nr:hypothetical protein [Patescibacteria group bacterium]
MMLKRLYKILSAMFFVALAINVNRVPGTNSYFTDSSSADGYIISTGWWVDPTVNVTKPASDEE